MKNVLAEKEAELDQNQNTANEERRETKERFARLERMIMSGGNPQAPTGPVMPLIEAKQFLEHPGKSSQEWNLWVKGFWRYLSLTGGDRLSEQKKMILFRYLLGSEGDKIVSASTSRKRSLDDVIGIMESYWTPFQSPAHFRMQLFDLRQGKMTIERFAQELIELGRNAGLGELEMGSSVTTLSTASTMIGYIRKC